MMMLEK